MAAILSKNSQVTIAKWTKYAGAGWVQAIKIFLSQNRIENLVLIILGRVLINNTQK
jgi:hypothetical protein